MTQQQTIVHGSRRLSREEVARNFAANQTAHVEKARESTRRREWKQRQQLRESEKIEAENFLKEQAAPSVKLSLGGKMREAFQTPAFKGKVVRGQQGRFVSLRKI